MGLKERSVILAYLLLASLASALVCALRPVGAESTAWTVQGGSAADFSTIPDTPIGYVLNIAVDGYGSTTPAAGAHFYEEDSEVAVYATDSYSAYGFLFDYWLLNGSIIEKKNNNPLILVMEGNYELTAVFAQAPTPHYTPSPTDSPMPHEVPEFPSWIIMPLLTIAALSAAIFRVNNPKKRT